MSLSTRVCSVILQHQQLDHCPKIRINSTHHTLTLEWPINIGSAYLSQSIHSMVHKGRSRNFKRGGGGGGGAAEFSSKKGGGGGGV